MVSPSLKRAQKFLIDRVRGHTFLKNCLNRTGKVVDLGMNKGEFARTINSRYGCSVAGVEANPVLAAKIADLRPLGRSISRQARCGAVAA